MVSGMGQEQQGKAYGVKRCKKAAVQTQALRPERLQQSVADHRDVRLHAIGCLHDFDAVNQKKKKKKKKKKGGGGGRAVEQNRDALPASFWSLFPVLRNIDLCLQAEREEKSNIWQPVPSWSSSASCGRPK